MGVRWGLDGGWGCRVRMGGGGGGGGAGGVPCYNISIQLAVF